MYSIWYVFRFFPVHPNEFSIVNTDACDIAQKPHHMHKHEVIENSKMLDDAHHIVMLVEVHAMPNTSPQKGIALYHYEISE